MRFIRALIANLRSAFKQGARPEYIVEQREGFDYVVPRKPL